MAVITAKSDAANQGILRLVRELDPTGHRTLAVITKPDTLARGSDDERMFLTYAENHSTNFTFKHGWHVIKNRGYENRLSTLRERDAAEESFFADSIWENVLGPENLGINALRDRLSKLLEDHTRALLPTVITSIKELTTACERELKRLGSSRETPELQRRYLGEIGEHFQRIVKEALEGNYLDDFFSSEVEKPLRHLRATIQDLNEGFAYTMATKGHSRTFKRGRHGLIIPSGPSSISQDNSTLYAGIKGPDFVYEQEIISEIKCLMRQTRGRELPTLFNPNIIRQIFQSQSSKWENIASLHLEEVWRATQRCLSIVAHHVANEDTARPILRDIIDFQMENKRDSMGQKLQEILTPYKKLHPITHNYSFASRSRIVTTDEVDEFPGDQDSESQAALNAWEVANTYYDVSPHVQSVKLLKLTAQTTFSTFVDNTAVLVVEMCLIDGLENIFSPRQVALMDSDLLQTLASENSATQIKRSRLNNKHEMLKRALRTCLRHSDGMDQGWSITKHSCIFDKKLTVRSQLSQVWRLNCSSQSCLELYRADFSAT